METTVWDADFIYNGPLSVRVSCHAGDLGRIVACNLVGDQPLFYMDDVTEEDMLVDYLSDTALEAMQEKLHSYDRAIECLSDIQIETTESRFNNAIMTAPSVGETLSVDDVVAYGTQSGLFTDYLNFIKKNNISVAADTSVETAEYDKENNSVYYNPHLDVTKASIALIGAMRMAWNYKQGILINPLTFQPEETVLINRMFAADLDVTKIAFTWDLKLAGHENVWNDAMTSSDYDLYAAYAIEAMADFRSIKNGLASRATFEKWFISDRCKNYDRKIIQIMLGNYAAYEVENMRSSRLIAMDVITRLGNRPQGKNYLSSIIAGIMTDSLYTEVRDRSNANFLWFVTFERRMREMEQELQNDMSEAENKSANEMNKDNVYELQTANNTANTASQHDGMATLFFLDHFRAG